MNISVHIERLILDGLAVAPGDRGAVQAAVEAELARLLTEGGAGSVWPDAGSVPFIRGGGVEWQAAEGPAALGTRIAAAVYGGPKGAEV